MYDIIIIGGGAGGMSAAVYAGRSGMKTLVIEGTAVGGQMNNTYEIDNYIGVTDTPSGTELAARMRAHAEKYGTEFALGSVKEIENIYGNVKKVITRRNIYETKTVIFATGANPRKAGVDGEEKFQGMGVSYCATCDGAFFKGQDTAVIGGGNTAFEDALYLSRFCKNVYLIHRRNSFRAGARLVEKAKSDPRITMILDSAVKKIDGDTTVSSITVENLKNGSETKINVSGVFVAVGRDANSMLAGKYVRLDKDGFIMTDREMRTNVKGVYACGDVRDTPLRQVITAAADGAVAATSAVNYINGQS